MPLGVGAAGQGPGVEQQQQRQLVMMQLGQQQQASWMMTPELQHPQLVAGGDAVVGAGLLLQGQTVTGT